jgi:hypothetical protein
MSFRFLSLKKQPNETEDLFCGMKGEGILIRTCNETKDIHYKYGTVYCSNCLLHAQVAILYYTEVLYSIW